MSNKYNFWMLSNFPQTAMGQLAMCVEFCERMKEQFPELIIKKGMVSSEKNLDNYSDRYKAQYPHCWLETPEGEKIDPTILQFENLGKLDYEEWAGPRKKCMGCGQYFEIKTADYYCGKCEWSE